MVVSGDTCQSASLPGWQPGPAIPADALGFAFSTDERLLAVAADNRTRVYSFPEMNELVTLETPYDLPNNLGRLAFNPDSSKLLVLSTDGHLYLWDLARLHAGPSPNWPRLGTGLIRIGGRFWYKPGAYQNHCG